jgi:DNA sulfur modification protein DndE
MKSLLRVFLLLSCAGILSLNAAETPPASLSPPPRIHMIGDSTMADKPLKIAQPERGWGQLLPVYFRDPTMIVNYAKNGRSTKSFIDEGLWETVRDALKPGDWVIIQFGHNDEKKDRPELYADPESAFRQNLGRFVRETRAAGANPILATPIVRRRFDAAGNVVDTHGEYPAAVRAVALELHVPLLELHDLSRQLLVNYGVEGSKKLYLAIQPGEYASLPDGRNDDTHLSPLGASRISELAIEEMRRLDLPLVQWLRN